MLLFMEEVVGKLSTVARSAVGYVRQAGVHLPNIPLPLPKLPPDLRKFPWPIRPRQTLPPGAELQKLAVPAFWTLEQKYQTYWTQLQNSAGALAVTVLAQDWPSTAQTNPAFKSAAQAQIDRLPGVVLGYVSTRNGSALMTPNEILGGPAKADSVQAWYDHFGQNIDGIYFDELVIPDDPTSVAAAQTLVSMFKAAHPNAKVMILAGQCIDEAVVGPNIDWALLWETNYPSYHANFTGMKGSRNTHVPSWWKNPSYRQKTLHVVHGCAEANRQTALGLAKERNAGLMFVMDDRGANNQGNPVLYDHLPPYWDVEVREANSYYDFGLDPERALRAAHRYGVSQGFLTAWPNFEQAWYGSSHVRGTLLLSAGPHAEHRDVALTDLTDPWTADPKHSPDGLLPDHPLLYDIPAVWRAAHVYAQNQGFETAIPTFEQANNGAGPVYGMVLLARNLPWLTATQVPLNQTYERPTFAEPGSVMPSVGRAAGSGAKGVICTFMPDDFDQPRGRTNFFNCYVFGPAAPITWRDVPTPTYIGLL